MRGLDDWLAAPYENQPEATYEECEACEGDGLNRKHYPDGGDPVIEDEPCEECGGEGEVEVDPAEVERRIEDERQAAMDDAAEERYYHDKYGD